MNIKDIVAREQQKKLIDTSKLKQDKYIRKLFYKDCHKMWKDCKKVEKPYFWWLEYLTTCLGGRYGFYYWLRFQAPNDYMESGWFKSKWEIDYLGQTKIKLKSNPNNYWVCL